MKQRKLPYIHILPRVLIGVLLFGVLMTILYVPLIARDILAISSMADVASPLPTATPDTPIHTVSPTPFITSAPAESHLKASASPLSEIVTVSEYSTLRLGDDNASVISLQQRLTDLGYLDSDMPDSQYNESIASAVVLFQRACNMDQTGVADTATQSYLFADNAQTYRIKRSDIGTDVLRLQQRLAELGFYTDRINGYFGPNTEQAVMLFQAINGLTVSGELDYDAWIILYSEDALSAPSLPTDTPTPRPTPKRTAKQSAGSTKKATAKASNTAKATTKKTATPKPATTKAPSTGKKTYSSIVAAAQDQLGKPYVWSAEGPDSFDCSGLVYYCLKQSGYSVSRCSAHSYSQNGRWQLITSMNDLRAGDLVFFKSDSNSKVNHTGICISSSVMIHASSSKGQVARSVLHQAYWERNFVCGRRP